MRIGKTVFKATGKVSYAQGNDRYKRIESQVWFHMLDEIFTSLRTYSYQVADLRIQV
jgi:hypothetical protein